MKAAGALFAGLAALVLVAVVLLSLPPVRGYFLREALSHADRVLPGNLAAARTAWPGLGTIEIGGLRWTDGADSLVIAERVRVSVDVFSLVEKDIRLDEAIIEGLMIDIPALTARFPRKEENPAEGKGKPGGFPRTGAFPGLPSVAADRIRVTAPLVRLSDATAIENLTLDAGIEIAHGSSPWVRVDTLEARSADTTWSVDTLSLFAAPDQGVIKGEGRGAILPEWRVRFSISPLGKDRFKLVVGVAGDAGGEAKRAPNLDLDITLAREDLRVRSAAFDGRLLTPGTRDLSRDPRFAPLVEGLPDLAGLALTFKGTLGLRETLSADVRCEIHKNNWIDGGALALTYGDGRLSIEDVVVAMPGFRLAGAMAMDPDSLKASVDLEVTDTRWVRAFLPDQELPEPLAASLRATAAKTAGASIARANLTARARIGDFSLDRVIVQSDLSLDARSPSRVRLVAEAMKHRVGLAAEARRDPDWTVALSPILIREAPIDPLSLAYPAGEAGKLRYSSSSGSFSLRGVRLAGDYGDLSIDAELDSLRRGPFSFAYLAKAPPPAIARARGLAEDAKQRLDADWSIDAPYTVEAEGVLASVDPLRVEASAAFRLPGPRNLAALLPDSARVDDLGPIEGALAVAGRAAGEGLDANVDLSPTEWIDSSAVRIVWSAEETVIDTLGAALESVAIGARGRMGRGGMDLTAVLRIADSKTIRRFSRAAPEVNIRGWARARGTAERPMLEGRIDGAVHGESFELPELAAAFVLDTTRVQAILRAPAGLRTPQVELDSVAVRLSSFGEKAAVFPVAVTLDAAGRELSFHQSLRADTAGGLAIDVETLALGFGDQDLRAQKPFRIRRLSRAAGIAIEDVDLSGSLGSVRLSGVLRPDSSDFTGAVAITLPEQPPPALARPHLWPDRVDVDIRAKGVSDLDARVDVRGIDLVDDREPLLRSEIKTDGEWLEAELSVGDSLGEILTSRARIPASFRIYPPSLEMRDGPVSFDAALDRLPAVTRLIGPARRIPQDEIVRISGRAVAGGTMGSPDAFASLAFEFTDWPKLSQYTARLEAALGSGARADSLRTPDGAGVSEALKAVWKDDTGIALFFELSREGKAALTARGEYPLAASLHPPRFQRVQDGRIDVLVESSGLPLADFDPFLPLDIGLGGVIDLRLAGKGPVEEFALEGSVSTANLEVFVAEQARAAAQCKLDISGSSRRPAVKGDIRVVSGQIRVPDAPKHLHPIEGESLARRDSLLTAPADTVAAAEQPAEPVAGNRRAVEPDFDVMIRIPSGFWIRGKGLDIELAGALNVKQKGGKPIIAGELNAVRGNFIFLGRTLTLERGTVTFYGEDQINPVLDIVLETNVDGNDIQILFGGTVKKPKINLTSDPEMAETDIMSVLLFGRTFEDLDDDQANLVRRRSAEMIASLGAVKLQEELGGQLGVDVVTVTSSGDEDEGTALSVGKYVNARTLLSYAYPLDSESKSYVSLEYFLKGRFVIKSTYDNEGVGSLGVGWSKDY